MIYGNINNYYDISVRCFQTCDYSPSEVMEVPFIRETVGHIQYPREI